MIRIRRTVLALSAICVLLSIPARVARSQLAITKGASEQTCTISGKVGLSGVTLQGLPGPPVTDRQGRYSVEVERGWRGTVTPVKEGYVFQPPQSVYERLEADCQSQDYVPRVLTFTISGSADVAGVVMKGLPGDPITDPSGRYGARIEYGWSGTVTPTKEGYAFEPSGRMFSAVRKDYAREDYTAKMITYIISGNVGVEGVTLQGLPGRVVSDPRGRYQVEVPYGWAGVVAPKKDGCEFEPPQRRYEHLTADRRDDDYEAHPRIVVISDVIRMGAEGPLEAVTVTAEPGGASDVTDGQGRFIIRVPYGWSGTLKLAKDGYIFAEAPRYDNVTHHLIDGQRSSPLQEPAIPVPRVSMMRAQPVLPAGAGQVLVIPTVEVAPQRFAEISEDMDVMLHILREKLSEPRTIHGVFYDFGDFFASADCGVEALYLQGYGTVFVIEVDFPFSFPSQPGMEAQSARDEIDPVWQRARQRLHAPRGRMGWVPPGVPAEQDEVSFDQFKEDLLKALKHAANIRHLDPNEKVIVTILSKGEGALQARPPAFGGGSFGGGGGGYVTGGHAGGSFSAGGRSFGGGGGSFRGGSSAYSSASGQMRSGRLAQPGPGAPTSMRVLTLQAKKSDIDAFAREELDLDQFRQRATSFTYEEGTNGSAMEEAAAWPCPSPCGSVMLPSHPLSLPVRRSRPDLRVHKRPMDFV